MQAIPGAAPIVILRPQPGLPVRSFAALPLSTGQRSQLTPPPHTHRHRYHGVLAPNATLRSAVTALAREASNDAQQQREQENKDTEDAVEALWRSPARYLWAMLLSRIYQSAPLACPQCGADMRIITFVTDGVSVRRILEHIGEPADPQRPLSVSMWSLELCGVMASDGPPAPVSMRIGAGVFST